MAENDNKHPWELKAVCKVCDTKWSYDQTHDAYYCKICNWWKGSQCTEVGCEFCTDRPARPLKEQIWKWL